MRERIQSIGASALNKCSGSISLGRKHSRRSNGRLRRSAWCVKTRGRAIRKGTVRSSSSSPLAGIIIAGVLAVTDPHSSSANEPIACGTTYVVANGDVLSAIAARAYGDAELASAIFAANARILRDANLLSIGDQLFVPCLDQNWPQSLQTAVETESIDSVVDMLSRPTGSIAPAVAPIPRRSNPPALRAAIASSLAPLAGAGLTDGGLVPDLVRRAINAAGADRELIIRFFSDGSAQIEDLLTSGSFEVSFPWTKPDCDDLAGLTTTMRQRCAAFTFSRPIVELTIEYFRRSDDYSIPTTGGETIEGKWVCQPSGIGFLDLGKSFPRAVIESAATTEACFELLQAGAVDIVAAPRRQAEAIISRMGIVRVVAEIDDLRTSHTLHAIASRGDLAGEAAIALIDRGMERLMISGEWFDTLVMHQRRSAAHW